MYRTSQKPCGRTRRPATVSCDSRRGRAGCLCSHGMLSDLSNVPLFSERAYDELSVGDRWGPFVESLDQATSDELRGAIGAGAPGAEAPLGILPLVTLRVLRRALDGIIP